MRPLYHYTPASNWLSDPNGLVHHDGEWHLFYQYNPHGDQWGHMSWGHAISADLASWTELAPALVADDDGMIFSGSAVVDTHDTAGFGPGALVAAYTGARCEPTPHQAQCLASSSDAGRTWRRYAGNPVLDLGLSDFRDPNLFWHAPTARWIMVVALANEHRALILASPDLKQWTELSAIGPFDLPGEVWECPLLIELPIEDQAGTRWLFKVDLLRGGPGSGAVALTGAFDGTVFTPDHADRWIEIDGGRDFYAAIAWHEPRDAAGRPCWIGWMGNHAYQAALPPRGWRGAMSLPRRLSLRRAGDRLGVVQAVDDGVTARFGAVQSHHGHALSLTLGEASRIDLDPGRAREIGLRIADDAEGCLDLLICDGRLSCTRSLGIAGADPEIVEGIALPDGPLTLWLDRFSIEIEAARGGRWVTLQHGLGEGAWALSLSADQAVTVGVSALA